MCKILLPFMKMNRIQQKNRQNNIMTRIINKALCSIVLGGAFSVPENYGVGGDVPNRNKIRTEGETTYVTLKSVS